MAVTGSTTTDLHQLLATLFDPAAPRRVIVADELNFPSDLHALQSHLRQRGLDPASHLRLVRSHDGRTPAQFIRGKSRLECQNRNNSAHGDATMPHMVI